MAAVSTIIGGITGFVAFLIALSVFQTGFGSALEIYAATAILTLFALMMTSAAAKRYEALDNANDPFYIN